MDEAFMMGKSGFGLILRKGAALVVGFTLFLPVFGLAVRTLAMEASFDAVPSENSRERLTSDQASTTDKSDDLNREAEFVVERGRSETDLRLGDQPPFRSTSNDVLAYRLVQVPNSPVLLMLWQEQSPGGAVIPYSAISLDGRRVIDIRMSSHLIRLSHGHFDPLVRVPPVNAPLDGSPSCNLYIVQFETQPLEVFRTGVEQFGAKVYQYVADHAYIVRMNADVMKKVVGLPYVRWVGQYYPAYRIDEFIRDGLNRDTTLHPSLPYNVMVLEKGPAQKTIVAQRITAIGGIVQNADAGARLVEAVLTPEQLVQVVHWDEVQFIDRWSPPEDDMDIVREIGGGNYFHDTLGLAGAGVRAEVMDSGIRQTHDDFNPLPLIHGPTPDVTAHGTSTYGIVFGDGIRCEQGMLPDATGIFADSNELTNRYNHTGELANPTLSWRAVFQSNSWGSGLTTTYTTVSADMDEMLFDHDILLVQSQSNEGNQDSRPQAWAKNILSVGGVRHYNTLDTADDCWCDGASIGPAADGRIKPDLAHFYDRVDTTDSNSDSDCTPTFNGTSAATPITAGHAGLWFQYWHSGALGNTPGATVFDSRPHMTLSKAMLICTADQWTFSGTGHDLTRTHQGWGRVNIRNIDDNRNNMFWVNETDVLTSLSSTSYILNVAAGEAALRAAMTYADPPGNPAVQTQHRINDLNLRVTAPSGTVYWGNNGLVGNVWSMPGGTANDFDTVECVFVQSPQAGTWIVEVLADEINEDGHVETPAMDADYSLVVVGATECAPPAITQDPVPRTVCAGNPVTFCVTAGGAGPLSYQWQKNGSNIPGATSSCYTIASVSSIDAGQYSCRVSNACRTITSNSATLTIQTAPTISVHPASQAICSGSPATFCITAGGTGPLSYQWRKNGSDIAGATSSCYTISTAGAGDAGQYSCRVTNICGAITTNSATLTIQAAATVTGQPNSQAICTGSPVTFCITASGTGPITYQWLKNGSNIPGATLSCFTISSVAPGDAAQYSCRVLNACGTTTSNSAALTVQTAPAISAHPANQLACAWGQATFCVTVTGTNPLSYQWRKNGADIPGATSACYTKSNLIPGDAGQYSCRIANVCGLITSNAATLTVGTGPMITMQPADEIACEGDSVAFAVSTQGIPPFQYQWRKDDEEIPGATAQTYIVDPVMTADVGNYDVIVTDVCGTVVSVAATLIVGSGPLITSHPANRLACSGDTVGFTVSAQGMPPLTYQWRKDDEAISGATGNTYTIVSVDPADGGNYDVIVTDACGVATSAAATLSVRAELSITSHPVDRTVCERDMVTFAVMAEGTPPITYQWRKNDEKIQGANMNTYTIVTIGLTDTGNYDVVVTDFCDTLASFAATLIVLSPGPGDYDADCDIDLMDFGLFAGCFSGPKEAEDFTTPALMCLGAFDFDLDSDIDLVDVAEFLLGFGGGL